MPSWRRLWWRLGGLPSSRVLLVLVIAFSGWILADVLVLRLTSGLARSTYDAMVRARLVSAPADPRIVIVDIDEASLARMGKEFGRWPWPRDTLATALRYLETQQPLAIVWDVLFTDADRISPGGDAALDAAVAAGTRSHFSVVRLPAANDLVSQVTRTDLPGLWLESAGGRPGTTVALIPPVLPAVAASPLGYSNGYADVDGVIRRYRYAEPLPDGGVIKSLPLSVLERVDPKAAARWVADSLDNGQPVDRLISWRYGVGAYRRVPFADLFAVAEGGRGTSDLPDFRGGIVVIGSTAPALHDIHPTPLSPIHPGVEVLATAIDNAIHEREVGELPRWGQALIAMAICALLALALQFRSVASVDPNLLLVGLPILLMAIGWVSLQVSPIFLDLQLPAGLVLLFLGLARYWIGLRRDYWCSEPPGSGSMVVWPLQRERPWTDTSIDRMIQALEQHAPHCRVVVLDVTASWPRRLRWPELACHAAIAGPAQELRAAQTALKDAVRQLVRTDAPLLEVPPGRPREELAATTLWGWAIQQKSAKRTQ